MKSIRIREKGNGYIRRFGRKYASMRRFSRYRGQRIFHSNYTNNYRNGYGGEDARNDREYREIRPLRRKIRYTFGKILINPEIFRNFRVKNFAFQTAKHVQKNETLFHKKLNIIRFVISKFIH